MKMQIPNIGKILGVMFAALSFISLFGGLSVFNGGFQIFGLVANLNSLSLIYLAVLFLGQLRTVFLASVIMLGFLLSPGVGGFTPFIATTIMGHSFTLSIANLILALLITGARDMIGSGVNMRDFSAIARYLTIYGHPILAIFFLEEVKNGVVILLQAGSWEGYSLAFLVSVVSISSLFFLYRILDSGNGEGAKKLVNGAMSHPVLVFFFAVLVILTLLIEGTLWAVGKQFGNELDAKNEQRLAQLTNLIDATSANIAAAELGRVQIEQQKVLMAGAAGAASAECSVIANQMATMASGKDIGKTWKEWCSTYNPSKIKLEQNRQHYANVCRQMAAACSGVRDASTIITRASVEISGLQKTLDSYLAEKNRILNEMDRVKSLSIKDGQILPSDLSHFNIFVGFIIAFLMVALRLGHISQDDNLHD